MTDRLLGMSYERWMVVIIGAIFGLVVLGGIYTGAMASCGGRVITIRGTHVDERWEHSRPWCH
jgi:hypothetical protein